MFIVTGTSGTTYLMHLLTELECGTGYPVGHTVNPKGDFEWPIQEEVPRIIKNPKFSEELLLTINRCSWDVEHVYILLRNYNDIAKSAYEAKRKNETRNFPIRRASFITEELTEEQHLKFNHMKAASRIGLLMLDLVTAEIPYTFLLFPRIVTDPDYLYTKCALFHDVKYSMFLDAFNRIADVSKVHHDS
jgi:hypothetical protein